LGIAWLYFLNKISGNGLDSFQLALEGYSAEVKEFEEGGGMMDHFTSVYGNVIFLKPKIPRPNLITYDLKLDGFVLGNSNEKKKTVNDLLKTKSATLKAFKNLQELMPEFNQFTTKLEDIRPYLTNIKKEERKKIIGNICNRDLTYAAKKLIDYHYSMIPNKIKASTKNDFYKELGKLLNLHHQQLDENIQISTEKINTMIESCLKQGALGCKINGSGFGGTMFALLPNDEHLLKVAIEEAGGDAFILNTSRGVEEF
jgi:galactokinase